MPRCILERGPNLWHLAREGDEDFMPIRCSDEEGIVAPGNIENRKPTCPDCVAIVKRGRSRTGALTGTRSPQDER